MKFRDLILIGSVAACLTAAGCHSAEEADELAPVAPPIAFEGTPEAKFAAVYKTVDGRSTYTLTEDGVFTLKGKVSTQGGTFENNVTGKWAVKDDRMLFQDAKGGTSAYLYQLVGSDLKLTMTGRFKRDILLKRVK